MYCSVTDNLDNLYGQFGGGWESQRAVHHIDTRGEHDEAVVRARGVHRIHEHCVLYYYYWCFGIIVVIIIIMIKKILVLLNASIL